MRWTLIIVALMLSTSAVAENRFNPYSGQWENTSPDAVIKHNPFNTTYVAIPKLKKEQTAIAQILSDMDEEIQTLQTRLSKTQQIKQGMMQQLLTGKVRLV